VMGLGRRRDLATGYLGEAPKQGVCFSLMEREMWWAGVRTQVLAAWLTTHGWLLSFWPMGVFWFGVVLWARWRSNVLVEECSAWG
jgi:hypothetical protein